MRPRNFPYFEGEPIQPPGPEYAFSLSSAQEQLIADMTALQQFRQKKSKVLNTYGLSDFIHYLDVIGLNSKNAIDKVLAAHGQGDGITENWYGGFLFKLKAGNLGYLWSTRNQREVQYRVGQHRLDFPELPDKLDENPTILNDWLEGRGDDE